MNETPEKVRENEELRKIYEEDVAELTGANWRDSKVLEKIERNCKRRKRRVGEIVSVGELKVGADYHHAALIFQHGDTTVDFKKANELAKKGMDLGEERSKWLYAATYDRWMRSLGKPQKYGTQFKKGKNNMPELAEPIDRSTTDEERAKYNVPPLAEAVEIHKKKYGLK